MSNQPDLKDEKQVPCKNVVMQPAVDRLRGRIEELRKDQESYRKDNLSGAYIIAEETIQSLYVAITVLQLTEGA